MWYNLHHKHDHPHQLHQKEIYVCIIWRVLNICNRAII